MDGWVHETLKWPGSVHTDVQTVESPQGCGGGVGGYWWWGRVIEWHGPVTSGRPHPDILAARAHSLYHISGFPVGRAWENAGLSRPRAPDFWGWPHASSVPSTPFRGKPRGSHSKTEL